MEIQASGYLGVGSSSSDDPNARHERASRLLTITADINPSLRRWIMARWTADSIAARPC